MKRPRRQRRPKTITVLATLLEVPAAHATQRASAKSHSIHHGVGLALREILQRPRIKHRHHRRLSLMVTVSLDHQEPAP